MQQLYSSVGGSEVRSGLATVISLAGFYALARRPKPGQVVMQTRLVVILVDRGLTMQAG